MSERDERETVKTMENYEYFIFALVNSIPGDPRRRPVTGDLRLQR